MKKLAYHILLLTFFFGLLSIITPLQKANAQESGDLVPNQYIVVLKNSVLSSTSVASEMAVTDNVSPKHIYNGVFKGYSATIQPGDLAQVKADPRVLFVSQDRYVHAEAQQTITFDDATGQNRILNGQYPSNVIDWGTNNWYLSAPWRLFTTKSFSFNGATLRSAPFTILTPNTTVISIQAFNGGTVDSTVTLSCAGQSTVTTTVVRNAVPRTISTNWTGSCTNVTLGSSNGWNTNFDNLVINTVGGPTPTPTSMPTPTITPSPSPTPTLSPTPVPTVTPVPTPGPEMAVSGFIFNDANSDGIRNTNESGVGNVTVRITNSAGTNLAEAPDRSDGLYRFILPSVNETDTVTVIVPAGYTNTTPTSVTFNRQTDFQHDFGLKQIQLVNFNDLTSPNRILNGQYPTAVINWGTNNWYLSGPWQLFTTNSIGFNGATPRSEPFTFVTPRQLVSLDAYNGGTVTSRLTLTCDNNTSTIVSTDIVARAAPRTVNTGWNTNCTTVVVGSSNGWNTNLDNLVLNTVPAPTPTPAPQVTPTGVARIGLNPTNTGSGITVAVLDTGIDSTHPDLAGQIIASKNCVDPTQPVTDVFGHGTHVAGTIAALNNGFGVFGVAPQVKLASVKVLGDDGNGTWSQIICGIDWVTQNTATYNIKVANMSLTGGGVNDNNCGLTNADAGHKAICDSTAAGLTYVVAAGNNSEDTANSVPASYNDTVITVSALEDSDGRPGGLGGNTVYGPDDIFASFSNFGAAVDLGAPGVDIYSTYSNKSYQLLSGTSMASPHVAAAAAMYIRSHPGSTWSQVNAGLKAVGEPLGSGHTDPSGVHPERVLRAGSL